MGSYFRLVTSVRLRFETEAHINQFKMMLEQDVPGMWDYLTPSKRDSKTRLSGVDQLTLNFRNNVDIASWILFVDTILALMSKTFIVYKANFSLKNNEITAESGDLLKQFMIRMNEYPYVMYNIERMFALNGVGRETTTGNKATSNMDLF